MVPVKLRGSVLAKQGEAMAEGEGDGDRCW